MSQSATGLSTPALMAMQNALRTRWRAAQALPEPDAEFFIHELDPEARGAFRKFLDNGVIKRVDRGYAPDVEEYRGVYQVTSVAHDQIQSLAEDIRLLPCGHRPFRNPRDVEGYTCLTDDCSRVFDRDTVEAALHDGGER